MKKAGKAAGTINRKVANLTKLLRYAHKNKRLLVLPDLQHRLSEKGNARERVLSAEEEREATLWFEHTGREVSGALFQFLLYTGCRIGEALSLDRKHVTGKSITFTHSKVKNGVTRTIPMVPKAKEAWDLVCKRTNSETPFGELMPYYTFRDHWAALVKHMGIDDDEFVPHMLRHTCATRLVIKGVPLPHVMKWLGHKSIQVTLRYTNLVPHDLDVAAMALS
jgi:integrase